MMALADLLGNGRAGPGSALSTGWGGLDLSIERLKIEFSGPLALGADLVSAAADRLAYYESGSD